MCRRLSAHDTAAAIAAALIAVLSKSGVKPLPRTAFGIDTLIVDPRSAHHNRTGGLHRTLVVIAVAHHQPRPVLVSLVGVPGYISGDFGVHGRRGLCVCRWVAVG